MTQSRDEAESKRVSNQPSGNALIGRLHVPASLVTQSGQREVTGVAWIGCREMFKGTGLFVYIPSAFFPFLLLSAWNLDVMAGAPVAILDQEVTLKM